MTLEEQLASAGHARVLVVLKPKKTRKVDGRSSLALDETISLQQDAAQSLRGCFKHFKTSRAAVMQRELNERRIANIAGYEGDAPPEPTYEMDEAASVVPPSDAVRYYPNLGVMFGTVDRQGLADLRDNTREVGDVIDPPELSLIQPIEDDGAGLAGPPVGNSWAIERLKVPKLWEKGLTGDGVLIGHLDTGVDTTHPALTEAVDAFAHFDELGRRLANPPIRDTAFHGTHTAGILVGQPFNGSVFGVAPGAKLASCTVIEGGDIPARVIAGLDWCVGQGVKVINVSLGVRQFNPQFSAILRILRQRGILPVVAIGNEGAQTSRSPGNLAESLSVGAIDELDQIWINSSSQQMPETPKRLVPRMIAPGAAIFSCFPNQQLRSLSGTSMAAPHVAGLAALLIGAKPEATVDQLEKAILASCKRPSAISTLRGAKGVPDAEDALSRL